MQLKLTKIEGHSPGLGLRAHGEASQPKLGAVGGPHQVGRLAEGATDLAPWREASLQLP